MKDLLPKIKSSLDGFNSKLDTAEKINWKVSLVLHSCASYSLIASHLPNLLFFVPLMKLELGPVNMFPLSAGAMFSLSTESDGGMVQGMTERELLTPALVHFSELHLWTAARGTQETQQCSPSSPFDWHLAHFYLPALAYQHPHVRVPIIQGAVATPSPTRRSESQPWGAAGSHEKRVFPVCSF